MKTFIYFISFLFIGALGIPKGMKKTHSNSFESSGFHETPTFQWASKVLSRDSEAIPKLHVTFSDGTKDIISLNRFIAVEFEEEDLSDPCSFMGTLENEPKAVVGVTGCPYHDQQEISIMREIGKNDITVTMHSDGHSVHNPKPIGENDQLFDGAQKKFTNSTSSDRAKRLLPLPENLYFRLVIGFDKTFYNSMNNDMGNITSFINKVMTQLQTLFHAPSLTTRITLDTPVPIVNFKNKYNLGSATPEHLTEINFGSLHDKTLINNGYGQHLSIFTYEENTGDTFTVGITYPDEICAWLPADGYRTSIVEKYGGIHGVAKTTAHEIGHNMGMSHNSGDCDGIMNENVNIGPNTWSTCAVNGLIRHYTDMVDGYNQFCFERDDPAIVGGSWVHWSRWTVSDAEFNVKSGSRTRNRICIGFNCVGSTTESKESYYLPCRDCQNLISDEECEAKKNDGSYFGGGCHNPESWSFMLKNCKKTCPDILRGYLCLIYPEKSQECYYSGLRIP